MFSGHFDDVDETARHGARAVNCLHTDLARPGSTAANLPRDIGKLVPQPLQRGVRVVAFVPDGAHGSVVTLVWRRAHFQFAVALQFTAKR